MDIKPEPEDVYPALEDQGTYPSWINEQTNEPGRFFKRTVKRENVDENFILSTKVEIKMENDLEIEFDPTDCHEYHESSFEYNKIYNPSADIGESSKVIDNDQDFEMDVRNVKKEHSETGNKKPNKIAKEKEKLISNTATFECSPNKPIKKPAKSNRSNKPGKIYGCHICNGTFSNSSNLKRHVATHSARKRDLDSETDGKKLECDICHLRFTQARNLKRHKMIHTGIKPFECDLCSYKCMSSSHLKRHYMVHTGLKPFGCEICGYRCRLMSNFLIHKMTHTGEKPHRCADCSYRCASSSDLKKHRVMHSGERPFKCQICQLTYTRADSLKKHIKSHSKQKVKTKKSFIFVSIPAIDDLNPPLDV